MVGSAGNGGDAKPLYPGGYPGVLAVAGTDQEDVLYDWATRGPWVALTDPGCGEVLDAAAGPAYACGSSSRRRSSRASPGCSCHSTRASPPTRCRTRCGRPPTPSTGSAAGASTPGLLPTTSVSHPRFLQNRPFPSGLPTSREVFLTTGVVRGSARMHLDRGAGPLALQLSGPAAVDCSMSSAPRAVCTSTCRASEMFAVLRPPSPGELPDHDPVQECEPQAVRVHRRRQIPEVAQAACGRAGAVTAAPASASANACLFHAREPAGRSRSTLVGRLCRSLTSPRVIAH